MQRLLAANGSSLRQPTLDEIAQSDLAAGGARDVACNAQAQPGAAAITAAPALQPVVRFEHLLDLRLGNARAAIAHGYDQRVVFSKNVYADLARCRMQ